MLGMFTWIGFGLIAGSFTAWRMEGRETALMLFTIGIGIAGALVGGFAASVLGVGGVAVFSLFSLLFAALGAVFSLASYRKIIGA